MDDFDDRCACCGISQSAASNLASEVFKVNADAKCGHRFCQRCIDNQINRKRNFCCPICHSVVIQEKLSVKSLDDWEVEKDAKVRRRIRSIYNKKEEDFPTLLEYQNFEERVEDIIFNLVHGIDRETTEAAVREYEKSNMRDIAKKQSKMQEAEHRELEVILQEEARWKQRQLDTKLQSERDRLDRLEYRRQMNEFLLNERDQVTVTDPRTRSAQDTAVTQSATASVPTTGPVSTSLAHPAHLVLYQRAPPKPTVPTSGVKPPSAPASRVSLRELWRAGGYEPMTHTRKNWREIASSVPCSIPANRDRTVSRSRSGQSVRARGADTSMDIVDSNASVPSSELWQSPIAESDLLFLHQPPGSVLISFGGVLPISWC